MIAIDIDKLERETSSLGNSNNILFHYEFVTCRHSVLLLPASSYSSSSASKVYLWFLLLVVDSGSFLLISRSSRRSQIYLCWPYKGRDTELKDRRRMFMER